MGSGRMAGWGRPCAGTAAMLLSCASAALAAAPDRARPDGLDGLAVVQAPTPAPLSYFDERARTGQLIDGGKFAEAEALSDGLARQYPYDGRNWMRVGRVKRELGKFGEAAAAYRKAMDLLGPGVPGNAEYWLAVSQAKGGLADAALDTLGHLLSADHYLRRATST